MLIYLFIHALSTILGLLVLARVQNDLSLSDLFIHVIFGPLAFFIVVGAFGFEIKIWRRKK
jgi:hypothetical protein